MDNTYIITEANFDIKKIITSIKDVLKLYRIDFIQFAKEAIANKFEALKMLSFLKQTLKKLNEDVKNDGELIELAFEMLYKKYNSRIKLAMLLLLLIFGSVGFMAIDLIALVYALMTTGTVALGIGSIPIISLQASITMMLIAIAKMASRDAANILAKITKYDPYFDLAPNYPLIQIKTK